MTNNKMGIGHIHEMSVVCNNPDLKFNKPIEFRPLLLLVGPNGSGKTFVLVTSYFLGYLAQTIIQMRISGASINEEEMIKFLGKNVYNDFDLLQGSVSCSYDSGAYLSVTFDNGNITNHVINIPDTVNTLTPIIYMSSNLRLFSSMEMYLKMRKLSNVFTLEQALPVMLQHYKLYDATYVETLINSCPIKFTNIMKESLKKFDFTDDIVSLGVDIFDCTFYVELANGKRKLLNTYGAGHQAIINMTVGSTLNKP
jgi:hypothetical protein